MAPNLIVRLFACLLLALSTVAYSQSCPSWGNGHRQRNVSVIKNPFASREKKPRKTYHGDYFLGKNKKKTAFKEKDSFKKKSRKKSKSYGEKAKGKKVVKSKRERRRDKRSNRREMKKSRKQINWDKDPLNGKPKKQKKKKKRKPEKGLWDQKMY